MPTRRQRRVAELVHRELSLLLLNETRDPRVAGVTITDVDVTPDLMLARIYFSVLGGAEEEKEAQAGLQSASGFLRSQLAGRIYLRFVPELSFHLDTSAAYARRIEDILDQIAESSPVDDEQ
jgi:ribosome-binding factor A